MRGNADKAVALQVAASMHRGSPPDQQDAMWLAGVSFQHDDLPAQSFDCTDGLFAIADGVANSPMPARASLLAVEALAATAAPTSSAPMARHDN